jgi:hypothetical protein
MIWYKQIISKNTFFEFLFQLDKEEFEKKHKQPCPCCNKGKLYSANYPRKPRGFPGELEDIINIRFSLCCSEEGCRRRYNPLSLRFFDRRVYFTAFFVFITCLRYGPTEYRLKKLKAVFGISSRTVIRWRKYWKIEFPETALSRELKGYLNITGSSKDFPDVLIDKLEAQHGKGQDTIILMIKNLSRAPPGF